ncbi:MAG: hypothetical protein ACTS2F_14795 [Thainema sp.]
MKPLNDCNQLNSYIVSTSHLASGATSENAARNQQAAHWLTAVLKQVKAAISKLFDQSQEPRITKRVDRWGNLYFSVYDPIDRSFRVFTSEQEIRIWLEQRYYQ